MAFWLKHRRLSFGRRRNMERVLVDGELVACGFAHLEFYEFRIAIHSVLDLLFGRRGIFKGLDLLFSPGLVVFVGAMIAVTNECN